MGRGDGTATLEKGGAGARPGRSGKGLLNGPRAGLDQENRIPGPMAQPRRGESRERKITLEWPLRTLEDGSVDMVVMTLRHERAGSNAWSGRSHPNQLVAQIGREQVEYPERGGSVRKFGLFSAFAVTTEELPRFSQKRFEQFEPKALEALREIWRDKDHPGAEKLRLMFDPEHSGDPRDM